MLKGYKAYQQIGTLLIKENLINEKQLQKALSQQKHTKQRLGNILINLNIVSQNDVIRVLGKQLDIKYITAKEMLRINPELLNIIPNHVAKLYRALPYAIEGKKLTVVVADPFDLISANSSRSIFLITDNILLALEIFS